MRKEDLFTILIFIMSIEPREVKVALMGPSASGKTHAVRTLEGKQGKWNKTIGAELYCHRLTTKEGEPIKMNIWDCSGSRTYERLVAIHLQRSDWIVVFYNPYKKESLEQVKKWVEFIKVQEFPLANVWIVRNIRNDWDYKLLDDGKTYFEAQGFKHFDLKAFEAGNVQAFFAEVAQALPKPPSSEPPKPEKPYVIKLGDLTLDSELLDKYIKSILEEEKGGHKEEEEKVKVVRTIEKRFSVREEDDFGPLFSDIRTSSVAKPPIDKCARDAPFYVSLIFIPVLSVATWAVNKYLLRG